eukprot:Gb_24471 [translate_table: standard]
METYFMACWKQADKVRAFDPPVGKNNGAAITLHLWDATGVSIRYLGKDVDSLCVELSKKRKLEEEQLNLPSSKHKFRTKQGNSDGGSPLLHACTNEYSNALRNLNGNKKLGIDLNVLDSAAIDNGSDKLQMDTGEQDANVAGNVKKSSCTRSSNARETEDGTAIHSSSDCSIKSSEALLQSSLVPADEIHRACSSVHSGISESSKHVYHEISCSYNHSCSSPGNSTTFDVGCEFSQHFLQDLDRKVKKKRTSGDSDCLHSSLQDINYIEDKLCTQPYVEGNQFKIFTSRNNVAKAEGSNEVSLCAVDVNETHSVESLFSAYKPSMVKRHKSVNTASCTWEFGSGSTTDEHTSCPRAEAKSVEFGTTGETNTSTNTLACNAHSIVSSYESTDAPPLPIEISEAPDADKEASSEGQAHSIDISSNSGETLPLYVLSSGRKSFKEGKALVF